MAILVNDIKQILANLAPAPKAVTYKDVKKFTPEVRFFDPFIQGNGGLTALGIFPASWERALDTVCNHIEKETDKFGLELWEASMFDRMNPIVEVEELPEEAYAALEEAQIIALEIKENRTDWAKADDNALFYARQAIIANNPWEILESSLVNMKKSMTCGKGIVVLLEDALKTLKNTKKDNDLMRSVIADNIKKMIELIINEADNDEGKPQERYWRWYAPLSALKQAGVSNVGHSLKNLLLDQSMPIAQLDYPEWVDSYTGETTMEKSERLQVSKRFEPSEERDMETEAALSSESFTEDEIIDNLGIAVQMQEDERLTENVRESIQKEIAVTGKIWGLKQEFKPLQQNFSEEITYQIKHQKQKELNKLFKLIAQNPAFEEILKDPKGQELMRGALRATFDFPEPCAPRYERMSRTLWKTYQEAIKPVKKNLYYKTRRAIRTSYAAKQIIDFLQDKASEESAADLTVIALSVQHGYGFELSDFRQVQLSGTWHVDLYSFIEDNGDLVLETLNDATSGKQSEDYETIQKFGEASMRIVVKQAAKDAEFEKTKHNGKLNALHHPVFIQAFLNCMMNSKNVTYRDTDGKWKQTAVRVGWEAWLENFNKPAFAAYLVARKEGKSFDDAKKAFWTAVKGNPIKKKDTIRGKNNDGLFLGSGRFINWGIAALKFKNDELEFVDAAQKSRLEALLSAKHLIPTQA